jgi:hypothetical protein
MKTWWNLNNPYGYRNENLRIMGFKSYRSYLHSDLWKGIRTTVATQDTGLRAILGEVICSLDYSRDYSPASARSRTRCP